MDKQNNKWIEDAFKEAQPTIDGMTIEQFNEKVSEAFKGKIERTMAAYEMTYGKERGAKIMTMFLLDKDIFSICKCFFLSGYATRMEEDQKKG